MNTFNQVRGLVVYVSTDTRVRQVIMPGNYSETTTAEQYRHFFESAFDATNSGPEILKREVRKIQLFNNEQRVSKIIFDLPADSQGFNR